MNKEQTATFNQLVANAAEASKTYTKSRTLAWETNRAEEDAERALARANDALQSFINSLVYDD